MLPFNNEVKVVDITEKDLVEVMKRTAGSILTSLDDAQLLRSSGMEYSVRNDKEYFLNGGKEPISDVKINGREVDVKNPDENRKVRVILNSYLFAMPRTKDIMAKYESSAVAAGREQEIFTEYLQNQKEVDFTKKEQRIKTSATYQGWGDFEEAQKEVMNKLKA